MQPEVSQPAVQGSEQLPMPPTQGGERVPALPPLETGIEKGAERVEQVAEARASAADAAAVGAAPQAQAPAAPVADGTITDDTTTPAVAADQDVIEKEWVDKAKQIIASTKDDPHVRSSKVNELQRDYLKKRYGKVLGSDS